ncbi:hypothetical protein QQ054_35865 [Oscillatoria amoena NRMC-F 0135]|nr:hypothetical protein [Oscillatoria amoena NRMC-F 0135]
MVRFRDDVPLLDPSMVKNLAPLRLITAPLAAGAVEMVGFCPLAGFKIMGRL